MSDILREIYTKDGTRCLGSFPVDDLEPVAERDEVWLQDHDANLMVINSILVTDRMDVDDLRRVWMERVMEGDAGRRYARFRRLVVRCDGRYYWRDAESFDIEDHIFTITGDDLHTKEGLQRYIGRQACRPLPDDRPLWQFQLVPRFGDGGSAVVTRVHHVMGDGVSLMPVIFSLMDVEDEDPEEARRRQEVKTRGTAGDLWKVFLKASLVAPGLLVSRALSRADRSPLHGPELAGEKLVAWTRSIDLERVKTIKDRLDATVNDVLLAAVSGAFRKYVDNHPGEGGLDRVRVSMPVNVRPPDETPQMENKFAAVILDLPVEVSDLRRRLEETKRRMNALKRSVEPIVYYGAVNVLIKILPKSWSHGLIDFYAKKCTAVLSNVPGPQEPMSIAGSRIRGMLFWVPQRANIGLGISILSFSGEVRIGVFCDVGVMSQPDAFIRAVEDEIDHLDDLL